MRGNWPRSSTEYLPAGRQGVSDKRNMYYIYVLKSEVNGHRYIGMSEDVTKRLKEHNAGKTKSTKYSKPWRIVHVEQLNNRIEARKREKYLKSGTGREFLDKLAP